MIVESVSNVWHLWQNFYEKTTYKQVLDTTTDKRYTEVETRVIAIDTYNKYGKIDATEKTGLTVDVIA